MLQVWQGQEIKRRCLSSPEKTINKIKNSDKQKEEDPVFGNLFNSSLTAKIKEQENYHQAVQKEAADKVNGMSSEDVLKMWADDPQKLDDFVATMEI